ncbi:MAG: hypothetical protein QNK04_27350 [Myxococcota bacterium]|nr:hypothetical protein [Myxococcota bacterium]
MSVIVRLYESEQQAHDAAQRLVEAGFPESKILLVTPTSAEGGEEEVIRTAVAEGLLTGGYGSFCTQGLQRGRSVVAVEAVFGKGQLALEVLESFSPVDTEQIPAPSTRNPAPLSDALGIPTLSRGLPFAALTDSKFALSSLYGLRLLSKNPAPLSSLLGMKTLSGPKRPWQSSFGLKLLSKNPAPLSSSVGMKTLSKPKKPWTRSFGLPLLSKNPAPLSSFLGLSVLKKKRRD